MSPSEKYSELLGKISKRDLRTWKRFAADEEEFRTRLFYHLESLRKIHDQELREALNQSTPVVIESDNWNRIVEYVHSIEPLSSVGSVVRGGRFNLGADLDGHQFSTFPALYIAEDYDTSFCECFGEYPQGETGHILNSNELALRDPGSFSSCRLTLKLQRVFDLTKTRNLRAYAKTVSKFKIPKDLIELGTAIGYRAPWFSKTAKHIRGSVTSVDWRYQPMQFELPSASQIFGRAVLESQFEGILFRSTKGSQLCAAIFPERLILGSEICLQDQAPAEVTVTSLTADTYSTIV